MKQSLYKIVMLLAKIHDRIMTINDGFEVSFSDKELHFIIVGLFGLGLFLVLNPFFHFLARKQKVNVITWIYTFTVLMGFTLAIEIGQHVTNTGNMELLDILYGLAGFVLIYAVFALIRGLIRWIISLF